MRKQMLSVSLVTALMLSQTASIYAVDNRKITKEETIYVSMDEHGKKDKATGSIHIFGEKTLGELKDRSNLSEIQVISNVEEFTQKGEEITWIQDDKHLYYQGNYQGELPVSYQIKYYLEDKEIEPKDILGKDGKLKIEVDSLNHHRETVSVKGQNKNLYVPYVVAGLIPLDKNNFSSITVDHGKLVSDGNRDYVLYLAMPGMKENFDLDFSEKMTITTNAQDFKMDSMYFFALPLNDDLELDLDLDIDDLEELKEKIETGFNELQDGTKKLYDGQKAMHDGVKALEEGAGKAKSGSMVLADGSEKLGNGIHAANEGASELAKGSAKLSKANKELYQTFDAKSKEYAQLDKTVLNAINQKLEKPLSEVKEASTALTNGSAELAEGSKQLHQHLESLNQSVSKMQEPLNLMIKQLDQLPSKEKTEEIVNAIVTMEAQMNNIDQVLSPLVAYLEQSKITEDELQILTAIAQNEQVDEKTREDVAKIVERWTKNKVYADQLLKQIGELSQQKELIKGSIAQTLQAFNVSDLKDLPEKVDKIKNSANQAQGQYAELSAAIQALEEGAAKLSKGNKELHEGLKKAQTTVEKAPKLIQSQLEMAMANLELVNKQKQLENVFLQLRDGSDALNEGMLSLNAGLSQLDSNAPSLTKGAKELQNGLSDLENGTHQLSDGSDALLQGVELMYNEIKDIDLKAFDFDFDELLNYEEELKAVVQKQGSLSGHEKSMASTHKVMSRTPKLEKEVEEKEDVEVKESEKGFFARLKALFTRDK